MQLTPAHSRGARGILKMTQEELAEAAGVGIQTVIGFEAGTRNLQAATLFRIQAALEERGIVFSNGDSPGVKLDPSRIKPHPR
jgi:transcriptional regulator with XRE-family HTH domain